MEPVINKVHTYIGCEDNGTLWTVRREGREYKIYNPATEELAAVIPRKIMLCAPNGRIHGILGNGKLRVHYIPKKDL